jgi:type II secretory ATPase GspE/PulE/Tfp pilus assembly ATPase PilB-like protein
MAEFEERLEIIRSGDAQDADRIFKESQRPTVVRIVNSILTEAIKRRASDIHLEPVADGGLRVCFRVDGILQPGVFFPKELREAILFRVKTISGVEASKVAFAQDERFLAKFQGREVEFRTFFLPVVFGCKITIKVIDRSNLPSGLDNLGFSQGILQLLRESLTKPQGIIIVAGPKGCGKSTTLYSMLNQLNVHQRYIVSLEEDIKYQVDGATQIQVNPQGELTFDLGLRSVLRQRPDVVIIDSLCDRETAELACRAALEGKLLLLGLNAPDILGAMSALLDMKLDRFLLASSLLMIVAQRLCRRICPACKEPYALSPESLRMLNWDFQQKLVYRGKGCLQCHHSGTMGRLAIAQSLVFDEEIKEMVRKGSSCQDIFRLAQLKKQMRSLKDEAIGRFLEGKIPLEEVK